MRTPGTFWARVRGRSGTVYTVRPRSGQSVDVGRMGSPAAMMGHGRLWDADGCGPVVMVGGVPTVHADPLVEVIYYGS